MLYTKEALDRATGRMITNDLGNFVTVTELGKLYGVGPKRVRAVLYHMGVLGIEDGRYRLPRSFEERGLGVRHHKPRSGYPFDVLSPRCQALIEEAWDETVADLDGEAPPIVSEAIVVLDQFKAKRRSKIATQQEVCWLCDHFPALTYRQMAEIAGVDERLTARYAEKRAAQISYQRRRVKCWTTKLAA